LQASEEHKRFHEASLVYIEKVKTFQPADKTKRPKIKLPALPNDGNGEFLRS